MDPKCTSASSAALPHPTIAMPRTQQYSQSYYELAEGLQKRIYVLDGAMG
jgi:hypothetical protein